jgi:hypothetical protein
MELLDGEAANVLRLLTADDVSHAARTEARDRLARAGVDVDGVTSDFLTYGTIRTHLRECAGIETGREAGTDADAVRGTVYTLVGRAEAVTERELSRLAETDAFDAGDLTVSLTMRVACAACGEEYGLRRLLERGGCGCREGESQT